VVTPEKTVRVRESISSRISASAKMLLFAGDRVQGLQFPLSQRPNPKLQAENRAFLPSRTLKRNVIKGFVMSKVCSEAFHAVAL